MKIIRENGKGGGSERQKKRVDKSTGEILRRNICGSIFYMLGIVQTMCQGSLLFSLSIH